MKNIMLIAAISLLFVACQKENKRPRTHPVISDILTALVDEAGNDLLDTTNANHINYKDIKFNWYAESGDQFGDAGMPCKADPYDLDKQEFTINGVTKSYLIAHFRLFLFKPLETNEIVWNENNKDTFSIEASYDAYENVLAPPTKIFRNGEVVWTRTDDVIWSHAGTAIMYRVIK